MVKPDQPPPLVLAQLKTTQTLEPDLVEAEFEFHLEVLHNRLRELVCEYDPVLKPVHISLRNREIESWTPRPGITPGAPPTLLIRLAERQLALFELFPSDIADGGGHWRFP